VLLKLCLDIHLYSRNALEQQDQVSLNGLMLKKTRLEAAAMFSSVLGNVKQFCQNNENIISFSTEWNDSCSATESLFGHFIRKEKLIFNAVYGQVF
jgi:hypothetical protein